MKLKEIINYRSHGYEVLKNIFGEEELFKLAFDYDEKAGEINETEYELIVTVKRGKVKK